MANDNRNWNRSSRRSDQDWNENRYQQRDEYWNEENRASYGNAGNAYDYPHRKVNYIPDHDENPGHGNHNYEDTQYGSPGKNGYRGDRRRQYDNSGQGEMHEHYNNRDMQNRPYDDRRQDWGRARVNTGNYDNGFFDDDERGNYNRYDTRQPRYGNMGGYQHSHDDRDRDWWDRTRDEVSSWFGDEDAEHRRRIDHVTEGGHRGKGPMDYRRSEDRIREDVCDRLTDDDYLDASNIQVQIQGEEVILIGTVTSREQKRRAEDIVESVSGVRNVENRIRVNYNNTSDLARENGNRSGSAESGQ